MNRIIIILTGILLLVSPAVVTATPVTFTFDGPDGIADPIATNPPFYTDVTSVSKTLNVGVSSTIIDLDVQVAIFGDYAREIDFSISHNAITVQLFNHDPIRGGNKSSASDVIFDDESGTVASGPGGENGRRQTNPLGLGDPILSAFDGFDVSGFWTLTATDAVFTEGNANRFEWSIIATVDASPVATPEPGTLLLMTTGLLGLVAYKRWRKISV